MPARFYSQKVSIRSDSVDSHPIVGPRPDHPRNSSAVLIGRKRLFASLDKVDRLDDSIPEVGMVCIDPSINNSYAHTSTGYPGVCPVSADGVRAILKRRVWISRERSETLEKLVLLD